MDAPESGPPVQAAEFELTVSVSPDMRLTAAVRDLARYAAQLAGGDRAAADSFGRQVEDAVRHSMGDGSATRWLPVTLRCRGSLLEVDVDGRTLSLEARGSEAQPGQPS